MYELLIRIETLCVNANLATLLGVGAVAMVAGVLLWLAGSRFSSVIVGILGAAVGAFCGLLLCRWVDVNSLLSMAVGAAVFCIAAVIFRNIIIVVLAVIIFALASGTTYSSLILTSPAQPAGVHPPGGLVGSFSRMDPATRLEYINRISNEADGFFEKLKALLRDAMETMDPHKWKLLLAVLVGGIGGLLLIWLVKKVVIALCCSGVGALLILVGAETLLMAAGFGTCSAFEGRRSALTITYFSMTGAGAVIQLVRERARKSRQIKAEKEKEREKSKE